MEDEPDANPFGEGGFFQGEDDLGDDYFEECRVLEKQNATLAKKVESLLIKNADQTVW